MDKSGLRPVTKYYLDLLVRYFLYNLVFQAWRNGILLQREERKIYAVAEAYGKRGKWNKEPLDGCCGSLKKGPCGSVSVSLSNVSLIIRWESA